ncbi:regulator of nonsense transcripts 3B [Brachyhypopomus gauderio]|uniref:regulator of nonsense transcripts 3B n=1 Tax=Brachyhypopomus gauderio TaxID=698409 RepID=UPI0040417B36
MKEDKENTRPREKRVDIKCEESEKSEKPNKEKKEAMTKIVIRRLPPSLTKEELEEQLQPLPEVDYLEFFSSDTSLYPHLFARAYLNFKNQEDIVLFRDRFDGYVFIDNRGQEYPAIVEFAPFQKIAKKKIKRKDAKNGTIEEDSDYNKFLEIYNGDDEKFSSTPETLLEEIEAKTKELIAKKTTPLLDFLKNKQRIREERKEEKRRRELERKRLREEERRKWREEDRRKRKEAERLRKGEKEKEKEQLKEDQPKIKLLKKPDKPENGDAEKPKERTKKTEREKLKEDRGGGGVDGKRRQNGEHREDKTRRLEEDGHRDRRDRDPDRERERERDRRQKEKERIKRQDEERRRRRERQDGENMYKKREEEGRKDRERVWEKRKTENMGDFSSHAQADQSDKPFKDSRKEESVKKDRLRNKDRPAIVLYQPGARSRNRGSSAGESQAGEKTAERDVKNAEEKGEE